MARLEADLPSPTPYTDPLLRLRALSARILHPDIFLPILSFLPTSALPPLIRTSRAISALAGPLLYTDLTLSPFTHHALQTLTSPLASLVFSPGLDGARLSPYDLRAVLRDFPSRKRYLLESARTLRVPAHHSHEALPKGMEDLRLDMGKVETLHLVGGRAVCHPIKAGARCSFFQNLRPKLIVLESSHLDIGRVDGLSTQAHERFEHLVVKLSPPTGFIYPPIPAQCVWSGIRRVTIVFTPPTYLDEKGRKVVEGWAPTHQRSCTGGSARRPSFAELVQHIVEVSAGVGQVEVIGAELLDPQWVGADDCREWRASDPGLHLQEDIRRAKETIGGISLIAGIGSYRLEEWRATRKGHLLDLAEVSAGSRANAET